MLDFSLVNLLSEHLFIVTTGAQDLTQVWRCGRDSGLGRQGECHGSDVGYRPSLGKDNAVHGSGCLKAGGSQA